jgi:hypothetical protein
VLDDVVDLPNVTLALVLASGGDVSVILRNGGAITLPGWFIRCECGVFWSRGQLQQA